MRAGNVTRVQPGITGVGNSEGDMVILTCIAPHDNFHAIDTIEAQQLLRRADDFGAPWWLGQQPRILQFADDDGDLGLIFGQSQIGR